MKLSITALFVLFGTICAYGQTKMISLSEVPASVQKTFQSKYTDVYDLQWYKIGKVYEAVFQYQGKRHEAEFSPNGQWLETEYPIEAKEIPAAVMEYMNKHEANRIKNKVYSLEIEDGITGKFFEIEFKEGNKEIEFYFDMQGNFVRKDEHEID